MKGRILLVEDEMEIASSLKMGLEREGYEVDLFCNPRKALNCYKCGEYDLLMLDIIMPEINGYELAHTIKTRDPKPPVWFVSASDPCLKYFVKKYPNIEGSIFIQKPVSLRELKTRLNRKFKTP